LNRSFKFNGIKNHSTLKKKTKTLCNKILFVIFFLGGRFTTVEGLMHNMLEEIEKNSIWGAGDATAPDVAERMEAFKETLLLPDNNLILTQFLILSFKHF